MACNHKFMTDLALDYVDWSPKTLFIGTFNPEWNLGNNYAEWFYGRTQRNSFWCILPNIFGEKSLLSGNRSAWISFCGKHQIAITDILVSINANEQNQKHREVISKFKDDDLEQFEVSINDIPALLKKFPSIKQVCITRQTLDGFWGTQLQETITFLNKQHNIRLLPLRSPSRGARRGVVGDFCEFISKRWQEQGFLINP